MDYASARHLVLRTQFGAPHADIEPLASRNRQRLIDDLLGSVETTLAVSPPEWVDDPPLNRRGLKKLVTTQKMMQKTKRERAFELKGWWLHEMIAGNAFRERIVLMWHNHFTTGFRKVKAPGVLFQQHQTFRAHAFGSFRSFLRAMMSDSALLFYLDNHRNSKQAPNENLSRELLELFTLGEGNYSERDIKEIARALTGRSIDRDSGTYRFRKRMFDDGKKSFLGKTNMYDAHDVVDAIMDHPAMPKHVARRVWVEFVSTEPSTRQLKRAAEVFADSKFDLPTLYKHVLSSDAFWDDQERAKMIKSPIELIVGTLRTFDVPPDNLRQLVQACRALGQDPYDPPNVKGWAGGTSWINSSTLIRRRRMMQVAARGVTKQKRRKAVKTHAFGTPTQLLAMAPIRPAATIVDALVDPTYQLK